MKDEIQELLQKRDYQKAENYILKEIKRKYAEICQIEIDENSTFGEILALMSEKNTSYIGRVKFLVSMMEGKKMNAEYIKDLLMYYYSIA